MDSACIYRGHNWRVKCIRILGTSRATNCDRLRAAARASHRRAALQARPPKPTSTNFAPFYVYAAGGCPPKASQLVGAQTLSRCDCGKNYYVLYSVRCPSEQFTRK
ncbi:hypothetical protein EVAR_92489_1 [Eumeta japonica]|uniref:Uncharacterized protein n=1 Tax=Eumeta variegata TaxID=151549 RepID=A0A4C1T8X8_EUMVA|nr:hypothetical protein EVAR_92489_1 [Eumeta japonica]